MPAEPRTILLTGAASGIGRAIAERAARSGANLVLGDIDDDGLARTVADLEGSTGGIASCHCDVRRMADVEALAELCRTRFGTPDVVFANAGIEGPLGAPWAATEAEFVNVIDINLTGIWRVMKATLPAMVERGSGAIVATASVAGLVGADGLAAYVASKHGVVGLVRSAAISVAKSGVRINALCPGMVETALLKRLEAAAPGLREQLLALKPMGRLGTLDEMAAAGMWLASDEAGFVTGTTLAADGGYAAQ